MTTPELLPCPFCGSSHVGWKWNETYSIDSSYATFGCLDCGASFRADDHHCRHPDDVAAWNRRTPSPEVAALIAEARREGWNAAIEAAAALAHPPQWERKGKPGLWRLRRAKIAAAIRALREETP